MPKTSAVLLMAVLLGVARGAVAQDPAATPAAPEAVPACGDCHEQAKAFAGNPHARHPGNGGKAALSGEIDVTCASCHGDGKAHAESGGDVALIKVVRGAAGAETCLSCHESRAENVSLRTGVHARGSEVSCLTCHSIHAATRGGKLLTKPSLDLCASCHPGPRAELKGKPFAHRMKAGVLDCASCHEPHGRAGKESLRLTRSGETACLSCHAEKKGPFVFPHVTGVTGDCTTCHQAHGSANSKQLTRATVDNLCLECHSNLGGGTLGSQPPAFHNLLLPRYRSCTTCHVAIHGSNRSPSLLK